MRLRGIVAFLLFLFLVAGSFQSVFASSPPLAPTGGGRAVILSSLNQVYPMGAYEGDIAYYLTRAGYQVTTLTNGYVTIDFLLTQLDNYNLIIWRTDTYFWKHVQYWYVGEVASSATETKYAADFAKGWINANAGILGVSLGFFHYHYTAHTLSNVKLMILIASDSIFFADFMLNAGVGAVIFSMGSISLSFGFVDDLTTQLIASLSTGQDVYSAVFDIVSPLDSTYTLPFWYQGNSALTI